MNLTRSLYEKSDGGSSPWYWYSILVLTKLFKLQLVFGKRFTSWSFWAIPDVFTFTIIHCFNFYSVRVYLWIVKNYFHVPFKSSFTSVCVQSHIIRWGQVLDNTLALIFDCDWLSLSAQWNSGCNLRKITIIGINCFLLSF